MVLLLATACRGELELGTVQQPILPMTHTVTVNDDGSFTPDFLDIKEGDTVVWERPASITGGTPPFTGTDAIVAIGPFSAAHTREQVCGAVAGAPARAVLPQLASLPALNFSGPKRLGPAGVHVLGPRGYGVIETTNQKCPELDLDPTDAFDYQEKAMEEVGNDVHRLCIKRECINGTIVVTRDGVVCEGIDAEFIPAGNDGDAAHISQVIDSVWANPDIDGVVLRIRWSDLQSFDSVSGTVVTHWEHIDRGFRKALENGKLVSIDIHAGESAPDFIFDDFVPPAPWPPLLESTVTPVVLVAGALMSFWYINPGRCLAGVAPPAVDVHGVIRVEGRP